MLYVDPPADWRPWLAVVGLMNCAGLVFYYTARAVSRGNARHPLKVVRQPRVARLHWLYVGVGVSVVFQLWVYSSLGGVEEYILAVRQPEQFIGYGAWLVVAESSPAFVILWYALRRRQRKNTSWLEISAFIFVLVLLSLFFGGLRGSRATVVWTLFWAIGVVHLTIRRIPGWCAGVGIAALLVFMYAYGFYKALNMQTFSIDDVWSNRAQVEAESKRTWSMVLLGDLERSDVQAFAAYRLTTAGDTFELAKGRTYLAAMSLLVPRIIWENRPEGKVVYGTELFWGTGAWNAPEQGQNIYGLLGEGMLNFGLVVAPLLFVVPGVFVGSCERFFRRLAVADIRWVLQPLLTIVCFWVIMADLDNVIWVMVKHCLIPLATVTWLSRPWRTEAVTAMRGSVHPSLSIVPPAR
jgi:hypothetical protein